MAVGLGGKLDSALFYPAISRWHLKLKDIVGTTSAAPWATFSALSQSVQYAEVAMWRECVDSGLWNTCMDAWLCLVLQRGFLFLRAPPPLTLPWQWAYPRKGPPRKGGVGSDKGDIGRGLRRPRPIVPFFLLHTSARAMTYCTRAFFFSNPTLP
jgi:hypothetical protein